MKKNINYYVFLVSIIFICAFFIRFNYITSTSFPEIRSDSIVYNLVATKILEQNTISFSSTSPTAYIMPGYPVILAFLYKIFKFSLMKVRIIQVILSFFTVIITFMISRKYLTKASSVLVLIIMSFYPSFIYANGLILTETDFTFFFMLYIYSLNLAIEREKKSLYVIAGIIFSISVYIRPSMSLIFVPIFGYYFFVKKERISFMKNITIFIITFFICMSPWWIRNYNIYNKFIPYSTSGSNALLWGMNPYFTLWETRPYTFGSNEDVYRSFNEVNIKNIDEIRQNILWKEKSIELFKKGMKEAPSTFIKWNLFGKSNYLWERPWVEYPELSKYFTTTYTSFIHLFIVVLGWIGIMASCFINKKHIHVISYIPCYLTMVHMVYHGIPRYAFPAIPILVIFSIYTVETIFYQIRGKQYAK